MQPRVLLAMPRYTAEAVMTAAAAFYRPIRPDSIADVRLISPATSVLTSCFNDAWARARNAWEAGDISHFAMIHADVEPSEGWIDDLLAAMAQSGADVVSAVVPIKDARGLSSTGVDDTGDHWRVRRLTMAEVHALPETFTGDDVGGPLVLNTGLWLARLDRWCLECHFHCEDVIRREGPEGRWVARCVSEDYQFSRQLRALGLKLAATRAVRVRHHGGMAWDSGEVWGWETDRSNRPLCEVLAAQQEI